MDFDPDDLRGAAAHLLRYATFTWAAGQLDLSRRLVDRAEDLLKHAARAARTA